MNGRKVEFSHSTTSLCGERFAGVRHMAVPDESFIDRGCGVLWCLSFQTLYETNWLVSSAGIPTLDKPNPTLHCTVPALSAECGRVIRSFLFGVDYWHVGMCRRQSDAL